jgi:hypothetical protein
MDNEALTCKPDRIIVTQKGRRYMNAMARAAGIKNPDRLTYQQLHDLMARRIST